jgi:hypothetical protein
LDGQIGFEGDVDVDIDISDIEDEYLDDAAASDKVSYIFFFFSTFTNRIG